MFKVKWLKVFPHKCLLPHVILNEGVNKLTRRKHFCDKNFFWLFERCLCIGNVSITHRDSFILLSFYGESLDIYHFSSNFTCLYFMISSKDISASQRWKCSFFLLGLFQNKFSSSSCGSSLGVEFHFFFFFFSGLRMFIGLLECFDLLLSAYNSNIVWFIIFCLSSTSKNVLGNFSSSSF